jgi:quinol monooxygenase YgiN
MHVISVVYTFPEERAGEAEGIFQELALASRQEAGCLGYEVLRGGDGARATFCLFEKWRDQAAFDFHLATEHFQRLGVNGFRTFATSRNAVAGDLVV